MHAATKALGEQGPAVPVVFRHAIFDRNDRIATHQSSQLIHHLGAAVTAAIEGIAAIFEEFGAGHIQGQGDLIAGPIAGLFDRLHQQVAGRVVAQVWRETALIAHGGAHAPLLQQALEGVEHLRTHAQRLAEAGGPMGHHHELLEVEAIGGMGAAIDHIHQRHRQQGGHRAAQIAVEGQADAIGCRPGGGQAHRQNRIGPQGRLVIGTIQLQHRRVHGALIQGGKATEGRGDLLFDVVHRLQHALAAVAAAAIAQFMGFMGAGAGAAGHHRPAAGPALQQHLSFHGGGAPGIEHLPGHHGVDHKVEGVDHLMPKDLLRPGSYGCPPPRFLCG